MVMPRLPTHLLQPGQQQKVNELVRLHHYSLIIELMGDKAVPPRILTQVKSKGLYRKPRPDVIHRSFMFGGSSLLSPEVLGMKPRQFDQWLTAKGLDIDPQQAEIIDSIRDAFSGYLQSYADEMVADMNRAVTKGNRHVRRKLAQHHQDKLFRELEHRKALATLAKDLTKISETQLNKAIRTIETETNNAFQDGRALEIVRKAGHSNPRVFKRPRPDACEACVKAYLQDDERTPKVFNLQELMENGSNIGKARVDRLPVVDSFHPFCACTLEWLPPGFGFNPNGRMVHLGMHKSA